MVLLIISLNMEGDKYESTTQTAINTNKIELIKKLKDEGTITEDEYKKRVKNELDK